MEKIDVVFLGDSITDFWRLEGKGAKVWAENFANAPYKVLNAGISADRTEHILWRLDNDQFAGKKPKVIFLMIGTNNAGHFDLWAESPLDTIIGIQEILNRIGKLFPETKVVLTAIFPRGATINDPYRVRNEAVNEAIRLFADGKKVFWLDINDQLVDKDGVLSTEMAADLLHPGERGYEIWAAAAKPWIDFLLGRSDKKPAEPKKSTIPTALVKTDKRTTTPTFRTYWITHGEGGGNRLRWKRHQAAENTDNYYDIVMIGDSITHFQEYPDRKPGMQPLLDKYQVYNYGFGGDGTEHILWNLTYGGVLDGISTRVVTLMIGTNNTWSDTAEDIADGIKACVEKIKEKQPRAKILLMPLLPREVAHKRGEKDFTRENGAMVMPKQMKVNELIRPLVDDKQVFWLDLWAEFLDAEGMPDIAKLPDGTHPNKEGYAIWCEKLMEWMSSQQL